MQRYILGKKNKIMIINGILIVISLIGHFMGMQTNYVDILLMISAILGIFPIALQAVAALKVKVVSIDVLVSIAVGGAFIIKNYEEAAVVTFLFLFGAWLEARTLNRTRAAIKELTELAPETALKESDGQFTEVDITEVDAGDVILVKTGARVPVDGTIQIGEGYLDEASITGESRIVKKQQYSQVYAGTILENGTLQITAERVGEETTFGKIIELVEEAQDSKSEAERFIDRFSTWYTPLVLLTGIAVWFFTQNIELAITILVLGCPGALVIGVPVSNVAGLGNGAKNGVLLKGSDVINRFSEIDTLIFDKTATLTKGNPEVSDVKYYGDNEDAIAYLVSVENESDHPLGKAIGSYFKGSRSASVTATDVQAGGGIIATVDNHQVVIGNRGLMEQAGISLTDEQQAQMTLLASTGNSIVLTAVDGTLKLLIGIRDQIREGVKEDLLQLKQMGIKRLIVLSGDNQETVDLIADELGLTEAHGQMLPEEKAAYVEQLKKDGYKTAFVGDGVNDSPSLALADIGIAMGNGTDVAIETSDVVLMNSDFSRLPYAIGLARATVGNMRQNIFIAIGVVLFLVASLFFSSWMNMSVGMFVHEGSILVVIINGMRLLNYHLKK
ncbi:heavy metal translocating P-type ATPase [Vagococcus vulneris]|uniref:Cd(2+)-exporting ATPase n=1 Tax=Vagococcus vulneris TaxID=1977869 RepID=A0A429ZZG7_9ENTE|nr:heavy metal translocating P-type ATPase [Vagococcus vulneris]RST99376.1 copper-translocating P-type ATPase [Vagococcus vulneris]